MVEKKLYERMAFPEGLQRSGVRRIPGLGLALPGQTQAIEQYPAQLLRRTQIELLAGQVIDSGFQFIQLVLNLSGDLAQPVAIQANTGTSMAISTVVVGNSMLQNRSHMPLSQNVLLPGGQRKHGSRGKSVHRHICL
jgi:hypothetical protein